MDGATHRDVDRLERVLESMATTHTEMVAAIARIEAVVEKETRVLDRVLDSIDKLERRVDELEQRSARAQGWRAGAVAVAGGGSAFGIERLIGYLAGN